ncbi:hypothetical protein [Flagellimonas eckloniae]|nr:hypothetical protein [Allomuricauda eckloniae]
MEKTKFSHKVMAVFLTLNFLTGLLPVNLLFASNNGPNSPDVAGFEPIDATDMVNLNTGNLAYTLPLMEVDGFPISMAYHAGVPATLDASWAGLGWYLNTGAINRQQIAVPDDWKAGTSINFISYQNAETTYELGVGASIPELGYAGVGISWGGNQGLVGMVEAGIGLGSTFNLDQTQTGLGINASANTAGQYYIGAYAGVQIKGSSVNIGANVGYSSSGGVIAGVGASVSDGNSKTGMSTMGIGYNTKGMFSIGAGGGKEYQNGRGGFGGGGLSMGSFSSGDYDISTKSLGARIPLIVLPIYIKFGKRKVTYTLRKGYKDTAYGSLYSAEAASVNPLNFPDGNYLDYQNRYAYMDVYEQELPQQEEEFITDYLADREKLNFTFAGYDMFDVQANGIGGRLRPRLLDNVTLFNRGYDGNDSEVANSKKHVFYHNTGLSSNRYFGSGNRQMQLYFDGTFSNAEKITPSNVVLSGDELFDMVDNPADTGTFLTNPDRRATTPSYVEVFTNQELADQIYPGQYGVTEPEALPFSVRHDSNYVDPNGIGAYRITSPDGKTYHFTLPVYQFEKVKRTLLKTANQDPHNASDVSESRQYTRYATHWLLTAVTGPDYVDVDNDGKVGPNDYGYWVRLDHGKWSDGYTWRQPYEDEARNYTTNIRREIDEEDFGYFSFGRKELYYLNKIVSREHTAFFVKDIRSDAVGKAMDFYFENGGNEEIGTSGTQGWLNQSMGIDVDVRETGVNYDTEYTLRLDKILLVRNENADGLTPDLGSGLGSGFSDYTKNDQVLINWQSEDFRNHYGDGYTYTLHQEDNILDVQDVAVSGIQNDILKEVRFNHSYDLAKNSPNSWVTPVNPNKGKLTLESVEFRGRQGTKYMPPYRFDYYDRDAENVSFEELRKLLMGDDLYNAADDTPTYRAAYYSARKDLVDDWGYIHDDEDRWSLKSIQMPTGASIDIEYEEDDYWIEAFSRRYWEENLRFSVYYDPNQTWGCGGTFNGYRDYKIYVQNLSGIDNDLVTDFNKYFEIGDQVYLDLWMCKRRDKLIGSDEQNWVNIPGDINDVPEDISNFSCVDDIMTPMVVENILTDNTMVLSVGIAVNPNWYFIQNFGDVDASPISTNLSNLYYYGRKDGEGSPRFQAGVRGQCVDIGSQQSAHSINYKLLANKIPEDEVGGGLKVTKVTTTTDTGSVGVLEYDYTFPPDHEKAGRSSGITSFAPVDGLQFVPYQSELPNPGVQYEYVTLYRKDGNDNILDYTEYNFHTLKPAFNIFSENLMLENEERGPTEDPIFWTEVTAEEQGTTQAKKIGVHLNTGILGSYKGIKQYNALGHILSSVDYTYTNGTQLTAQGQGHVQESFNSLKSVFRTDSDGNGASLTNRLLSVSTRSEYNNAQVSISNTANGHTSTVTYTDVDPILGSYRNSETLRADGTYERQRRIPAYEVYPTMGPKAEDPNNTNMLTQEAMMLTDVQVNGQWQTTQASTSTWHDETMYEDETTTTNDGIWRKLGSWAWRGAVDVNGTYGREVTTADFQWGYGQSQTNSEWLHISETTRYNHYSMPLESRDLNGNYVSSKTGADGHRFVAAGNAAYNELFFSGAEESIGTDLGGGVTLGTGTVDNSQAHTGTSSVNIASGGNSFVLNLVPETQERFKASVWVLADSPPALNLQVGGASVNYMANEVVRAGQWTQLSFYFDATMATAVQLTNQSGNAVHVDDFRLHPVASAMSCYVYNDLGELSHMLGANNLGIEYVYDTAGRLQETRNEVVDYSGAGSGGFKKGQEYSYTYKYSADETN